MTLAADVENPVFFDPFACLSVAVKAARMRNKLALRARRAGNSSEAERHEGHRDFYMRHARDWFNTIDWSDDE